MLSLFLFVPLFCFSSFDPVGSGVIKDDHAKMGSGFSGGVSFSWHIYLNTDDNKFYLEVKNQSSFFEKYTDDRYIPEVEYDLYSIGFGNFLGTHPAAGVFRLKFTLGTAKGTDMPFVAGQKKPISIQLDVANLTDLERRKKGAEIIVGLVWIDITSPVVDEIKKKIDENKKSGASPKKPTVDPPPTKNVKEKTITGDKDKDTQVNQDKSPTTTKPKPNSPTVISGNGSPTLEETVDYISKECGKTQGKSYVAVYNSGKEATIFIRKASEYGGCGVCFGYNAGTKKYYFITQSIESYPDENPNPPKKYKTWNDDYAFYDPSMIVSISEISPGMYVDSTRSDIGFMRINFSSKVVEADGIRIYHFPNGESESENVPKESTSFMIIPYFRNDPTAFNRIKKAFLHLKELSTASDPFGDH